ncbi:replication restart DNA helicase PriA [Desulfocapsa sulfexigens DSM 10523]|uniref:Replication restart protein PriA n=1 Tax=Desulfocapsa sulfexigens (strain DSM 10523 / SB164P1) TaxID=1167006 RepID=M1PDM9_DESSD|nr:primosomal protein N' [Desulfocapsa sulfexigens]AGF79697.1 replication restart DNA helicase PriA [Desulfocapsa sulfexigens DSM 10523]
MSRIEVAVAAPLFQTLSYSFDSDKDGDPVGRRVLVRLGPQKVTGYVLGLLPDEDVSFRILPVLRFLDDRDKPLFPENLVPFFKWIADYYHYPIGEVVKTALPGGLTLRNRKVLQVMPDVEKNTIRWPDPNIAAPDWFSSLLAGKELSAAVTKKILIETQFSKAIDELKQKKLIRIVDVLDKVKTSEKLELCYRKTTTIELPQLGEAEQETAVAKGADQLLVNGEKLSIPMIRTLVNLTALAREQGVDSVAAKDLRRMYSGASRALKELEKQGLVCSEERRIYRNPFGEILTHFPKPESLSEEQTQVLSEILPALQQQTFTPFLLHGVTGCGKTEVYLRAAEETLTLGRDVLVLVPEIALATQLEAHFVSRFGDQVVLLHSGLSPGERYDQWSLAASGRAKIVIGARSAVFAPLSNPGLIVVDEEHDGAYKQEDGLRYQGRDLAILRGRYNKAVVILGSGTPTVTSFASAMKGKFTLLSMRKRVENRPLPTVQIVDLRDKKEKNYQEAIGKKLHKELGLNLEQGKQSILLLNRRGFSSVYLCSDCGEPVKCLHCHVSLTYHKRRAKLVCHYCGYTLKDKVICGACQSTKLTPVGYGTERIEMEIQERFPEARVARIDSDTAADRRAFLALLKKMHQREIDILIGTQMIAKGHDFPHVTLVGVIWADGGLSMPDYRGAERTYQLLSQVTGRAGRGDSPGRVIVQTLRPEHYAIQFARVHDYERLYQKEMENRANPKFPPFLRMINLKISGGNEGQVQSTAAQVAALCRTGKHAGIEILGPAPSPVDRIRDRYRWQVLLKGADSPLLHGICGRVLGRYSSLVKGDIRIAIDVDPESMM